MTIKNILLSCMLLLISSFISFAQDSCIVIGKKHNIYSRILDEERSIWIYLPASYNDSVYSQQSYPVLYIFDGDSHFHSVTGIQQYLSKGLYAMIPEMITVAILNTDRTRDLTPTHDSIELWKNQKVNFNTSGGGEKFFSFLNEELIPYIDSTYHTSGYRILTGHSFGGLTVINTLLKHTGTFDAYIAIDPSLWWNDRNLLNHSDSILSSQDFNGKILYFSMANKALTEHDTTTDHSRAIKEFQKILSRHDDNGLQWKFRYFDDEDHGSISLPSEYYGLKYIFDGYQADPKENAYHPEQIIKLYSALSEKLHFTFLPPESLVDWVGNYCVKLEEFNNALQLFELNIKNYPQSYNAYKSSGNYYYKMKNYDSADEYFKKALELNPNDKNIQDLLKKIR